MALYTNCSIRVKLTANYTKKDELTKFLESEFVACEMNFEESTTDNEPYVQEVIVPESTQLGSLRASEWAPLGGTAPTENISGEYLARSASETILKLLESSSRTDRREERLATISFGITLHPCPFRWNFPVISLSFPTQRGLSTLRRYSPSALYHLKVPIRSPGDYQAEYFPGR